MKSKLIQKFTTAIIVLLITACFVPSLTQAGPSGKQSQGKKVEMKGHQGPVLGIWRNPHMVETLKLTEDQVKQIRDTDFVFREKHLVLKAKLDSFHLQLDKAFSSDKVDNKAVLNAAEAISDVKGKLFVQSVESRLALGKILTADQIKKMNLYDMQPKRKGPGLGDERRKKGALKERLCDEKTCEK